MLLQLQLMGKFGDYIINRVITSAVSVFLPLTYPFCLPHSALVFDNFFPLFIS